jgi:acyl dehydratase
MRTIAGADELRGSSGEELGISEWHEVSQDVIDAFATATGDDYWIHVDRVRAAASSLGETIAHGLLTLSLGPMFMYSLVRFEGFAMTLNYGYERVRFPAPLPAGARVRMRCRLAEVTDLPDGARARVLQHFESDRSEKPVCVAALVLRFVN